MRTFTEKPKAPQQTTSARSTIPGRARYAQSREVNSILPLQRTTGNQAVQRMLDVSAEEFEVESPRPRFGHDFANVRVHSESLRQAGATAASTHPAVHEALNSPGQPLDAASLAFFQPRFGHDFSHVRVHSDAKAAASAREVGALAYTVGTDLVFASGAYNPSSEAGRKLLAHELTHHVQQSAQISRGAPACVSTHGAEAEADRNAERVGTGAQAEVNVAAPVSVAMKSGPGDPAADRSYWFQSKPPEKPTTTKDGIEITPKGQVFLARASP